MSRFSHRQPIWTFGPVVLLSTLLLSPVAASVLLRAFLQALPAGELQANAIVGDRSLPGNTPVRGGNSTGNRQATQPRRIEEENHNDAQTEGDPHLLLPDEETQEHPATHTDVPLTDIALLLPTRILVTIPDDARLSRLQTAMDVLCQRTCRAPIPPRAPPQQAMV